MKTQQLFVSNYACSVLLSCIGCVFVLHYLRQTSIQSSGYRLRWIGRPSDIDARVSQPRLYDVPAPIHDANINLIVNPKVLTIAGGQGIGSAIVYTVRTIRYMQLMAVDEILYIDFSSMANITKVFLQEYVALCGADEQHVRCIREGWSKTMPHTQMMGNRDVDAVHVSTPFARRYALNKEIYAKFFSFTDAVGNRILKEVTANLDMSILVRRGDKLTLEKHLTMSPIEGYAKRIMDVGARTVFVATDDYTTVEDLRAQLPGVNFLTACAPSERGFFLHESAQWDEGGIRHHLDKFSKEIHAIIIAPYAVLDMASNTFAVALYGRVHQPLQTLLAFNQNSTVSEISGSSYFK